MRISRKKLFLENFLAYGAINALDKIVPIVMLPVITRLLTDTPDYGRFEMFNTIVGLGSAFAILGVYDAMFREYFEKDDPHYKNLVTSTALKIVLVSGAVSALLLIIFSKYTSTLFLGETRHWNIVVLAALGVFMMALRAIVSAPTRMKNKRKVYVFSGISYSLVYYLTAFGLIKYGMSYMGMIYGSLVASAYILIFFSVLNRHEFSLKRFDYRVMLELLKLGVPLVPVFVIYWAFNSMDKIMISKILGMEEVGIYSIGAKVASVSTFIYAAFAGGWQYFAFSTMKDEDQVEVRSKIFEYLALLSFTAYTLAIIFNRTIFNLFFEGSYLRGSEVFPYLFLSPLLLMLFQTAANQMSIIKETYYSPLCLTFGLCTNLILNYAFIQKYGIKGASIATLAGYAASVFMMASVTIKKGLLIYTKSFLLVCIIHILITITSFLRIYCLEMFFIICSYIMLLVFYSKDIKLLLKLKGH